MAINGLKTLYKNLSELDLEREQYQIISDNADEIVLAQAEVLSEGKDKSGRKTDDRYKPFTIAYKRQFGQGLGSVVDRVTFFMTGNLYYSLFARVTAKTFVVTSPLETYTKMINRIGKDNYGLDPERKEKFRQEITLPSLKKVLFTKTGLHLK